MPIWNKKFNHYFLSVMIIMSSAIKKMLLVRQFNSATSAFSFDCFIKIWHAHSYTGSIMHSTGNFAITVSNNKVSCRPHLEHIAAAVIGTCAHCCLTVVAHCYVMLGTTKFLDKSAYDNSARRWDRCDIIASCSEVRRAAQQSCTANKV